MTEAKGQRSQTRGPDRNRVLWAATVLTPDGAHQVRVRDLSNTGAHVLAERPLPVGSDAIFRHGHDFVASRIAWSNETEAGIQFYRELDLAGGPPA